MKKSKKNADELKQHKRVCTNAKLYATRSIGRIEDVHPDDRFFWHKIKLAYLAGYRASKPARRKGSKSK